MLTLTQDNIGKVITVQSKEYVIEGISKRSFIVVATKTGSKYVVSPAKLDRLINAEFPKSVAILPVFFQQQRKMAEIFNRTFDEPTKDNAVKWAGIVYSNLSPENLTCDGELSRTAVQQKAKELYAALNYLNRLAGREITEEETFDSSRNPFHKSNAEA